jgi:hypothetical protein
MGVPRAYDRALRGGSSASAMTTTRLKNVLRQRRDALGETDDGE